jgi:apolipoprotein N-acyltransferase
VATKHFVQRALLCLVAGLAFTLGLSPFDLKLASIASVGCLFLAIQGQGWRQGALLGWIYGVGFFGAGVSWVYVSIHIYGQAPVGLAAALTAFFVAASAPHGVQTALFCAVQPRDALSRVALFTALWVVFEWVRTWFLTGFPWLFIGYAAIDTPIEGWAPVLGVLGVSLILVSTACAIAEALTVKTRRSAAYLGLWLLIIMSSGLLIRPLSGLKKSAQKTVSRSINPISPLKKIGIDATRSAFLATSTITQ